MPDCRNHARQMQTPTSETRRWDLTSNLTRRPYLISSDHNILNLDDESRNDHRSRRARRIIVLVTQLSHESNAQETTSCLRRFLPPFQESGRIRTDNSKEFIKAFQDLQRTHDTHSPRSTRQRRNSDSDGSEWLTRTMVGLCDGMLLLLATRARQEGRLE